jgi:hypothetical protein
LFILLTLPYAEIKIWIRRLKTTDDYVMTKKLEKVKLTLLIPVGIDTQIKVEAAMQRRNISDVVAIALAEYVERQNKVRGGAA